MASNINQSRLVSRLLHLVFIFLVTVCTLWYLSKTHTYLDQPKSAGVRVAPCGTSLLVTVCTLRYFGVTQVCSCYYVHSDIRQRTKMYPVMKGNLHSNNLYSKLAYNAQNEQRKKDDLSFDCMYKMLINSISLSSSLIFDETKPTNMGCSPHK